MKIRYRLNHKIPFVRIIGGTSSEIVPSNSTADHEIKFDITTTEDNNRKSTPVDNAKFVRQEMDIKIIDYDTVLQTSHTDEPQNHELDKIFLGSSSVPASTRIENSEDGVDLEVVEQHRVTWDCVQGRYVCLLYTSPSPRDA